MKAKKIEAVIGAKVELSDVLAGFVYGGVKPMEIVYALDDLLSDMDFLRELYEWSKTELESEGELVSVRTPGEVPLFAEAQQ